MTTPSDEIRELAEQFRYCGAFGPGHFAPLRRLCELVLAATTGDSVTLTAQQARRIDTTLVECTAFLSSMRKEIEKHPFAVVDANRITSLIAKSREALGIPLTSETA